MARLRVKYIKYTLTTSDTMVNLMFVWGSLIVGILFMFFFNWRMMREKTGDDKTREIAKLIQIGASKFLRTEFTYIGIFVLVVALLLYFMLSPASAISFVVGAVSSSLAGIFGMNRAVRANVRTTNAAKKSLDKGLRVSFSAGITVGIAIIVLGVGGLLGITLLFDNSLSALLGYSFGVAAIALFARVGGGIYTKAADVGADLVGKVEAGIPEDDPRNPAVIADNVGDNVSNTAGMGADLFDSLIVNLVAAMAIGTIPAAVTKMAILGSDMQLTFFYPIFVVCAGLHG